MASYQRKWRTEPDLAMLCGALGALAGYLWTWFEWSSGWFVATHEGGEWTRWTVAFLIVALVASLWAGRSLSAATWGVAGGTAAALYALAVVAAAFANIAAPDRPSDPQVSFAHLADVQFGVGLPLLTAGLAVLIAGGIRAVSVRAIERNAGRETRQQAELTKLATMRDVLTDAEYASREAEILKRF